MIDEAGLARAVDDLAGLIRSGLSVHEALARWHEKSPERLRPQLHVVARRLALGAGVAGAMRPFAEALGSHGRVVAVACSVHAELGGEAARTLDSLARLVDASARARARARAATAGARLSAWMVAGLPAAMLPLILTAGAPLLDVPGIAAMLAGSACAVGGMTWMTRLVPDAPAVDGTGVIAGTTASLVRGGIPPADALRALAATAPDDVADDLVRAERRVRLGMPWPDALAWATDEGVRALGAVLQSAMTAGLPVGAALDGLADARRARAAGDFEARLRRAPVKMTVPLTVLVLPAFLLLGVVPFLRGLA